MRRKKLTHIFLHFLQVCTDISFHEVMGWNREIRLFGETSTGFFLQGLQRPGKFSFPSHSASPRCPRRAAKDRGRASLRRAGSERLPLSREISLVLGLAPGGATSDKNANP